MRTLYTTNRLIVRKWEATDAADLYEYCSNPKVTKFLTFETYQSIDDARARIGIMQKNYEAFENGERNINIDFAIQIKEQSKAIGSIGFAGYNAKAGGILEIGYMLNPKFQGHGYMTEALKGMFKYTKKEHLASRIQSKHDTNNPKSGAVMRRAGMTFEGILRKSEDNNFSKRYDVAMYSILVEEI